MQTMERPIAVLEPARAPEPPEPRRACARDVFVTIVVCLCLSALLALLRPLVAISDGLFLSGATSSVERALGRDPGEAPGGELILPAFDLPPDETESKAIRSAPAGAPDPSETSEPTTRDVQAEA